MKYEAMDEEDVQPSGTMIPIAIAVLAMVLGASGLYFGFSANKRLNSIDTSIQESTTNAAETEKAVTFFDSQIAGLETKISDQERIINRLKVYNSQSEKALKTLASELSKNREQIVKTANQLNEIKAGRVRVSPVAIGSNKPAVEDSGAVDNAPENPSAERKYTIVSGDTFGKIAARFGVSLQSIIDANPDADPRRLAIGQKITIPAE